MGQWMNTGKRISVGVGRNTESAAKRARRGGMESRWMRRENRQAGKAYMALFGRALDPQACITSFHCSSEMTSGSSATSSVCLDSKSITLIVPKSRTPALVVRYLKLVSKHAPAVRGPIRTSGVKVKTVCSPVVSCAADIAVVSLELARLSNRGFTETAELLLCAVTIANLLLRLLLFKHWT